MEPFVDEVFFSRILKVGEVVRSAVPRSKALNKLLLILSHLNLTHQQLVQEQETLRVREQTVGIEIDFVYFYSHHITLTGMYRRLLRYKQLRG